jgi:hypothetical protein
MAWEPFEGCWNRIDRATRRREEAVAVWNAFLDEEPYGLRVTQKEYGTGEFVVWIEQTTPVPADLGLNIGEWLYHLRAALDGCIYDVAVNDTGQNPPPKAGQLQFPICTSAKAFTRAEQQIAPLSKSHRDWVKQVQPYQGGEKNLEKRALYWVNELARLDRHRFLHVVGAYIAESKGFLVDAPTATSIKLVEEDSVQFIDGDTDIARVSVAPFSQGDNIWVNPQLGMDPEIAEWASREPAREVWGIFSFADRLRVLQGLIEQIVGQFERDCTGYTRVEHLLISNRSNSGDDAAQRGR